MRFTYSLSYVIGIRKWLSDNLRSIAFVLSSAGVLLGIVSSLIQIRGGNGSEFLVALKEVSARWWLYWFQYLADWRALLFAFAIIILIIEVVYQTGEKRSRTLMLDRKNHIDGRLRTISPPDGHYLALVIGKLGDKAREIQRKRARDIINSINKNIKKDEEVYWISLSEIGILMYEAKGKAPLFFIDVIFNVKLPIQLNSVDDAKVFADDITFAMVTPNPGDKLEDVEFAARVALEHEPFLLKDIKTKQKTVDGVSLPPSPG